MIDGMAWCKPAEMEQHSMAALDWAQANSWDVLLPRWEDALT